MDTHTARTTVPQEVADAYAYLKDPSNLPDYFPRMIQAEEVEPGLVRTTADVDADQDGEDERVTSDAWFRTDDDARSVSWGSPDNDYRGELRISVGEGESTIELSVSTIHDIPDVQQGLEESLAAIARCLQEAATG